MPAAFPTTAHTNSVQALADLQQRCRAAGYTPNAVLGDSGVVMSILANLFTAFPSTVLRYYTANVAPGNVAGRTTKVTSVTYTGVAAADRVVGWQTATNLMSGVIISNVRVTGANTIAVTVANVTVGALNPVTAFDLAVYVVADPDPA